MIQPVLSAEAIGETSPLPPMGLCHRFMPDSSQFGFLNSPYPGRPYRKPP